MDTNDQDNKAILELFHDMLEYKKREAKFLFIVLIISLCVNVIEVAAFLWFESRWEYTDKVETVTTTEQSVDGDDGNIVNGDQYNDSSQNNKRSKGSDE